MDPATGTIIGAGITAGVGLLQGLFGAAAAAQREKANIVQRGLESGYGIKSQAKENLSKSQQQAFANLMSSFKESLVFEPPKTLGGS